MASLSQYISSIVRIYQSNFIYHTETDRRRYFTRKCPWKSTFHTRLHYDKQRRINKLDIEITDTDSKEFEDEYIVIAIGSTGISNK
jgi:hypothetical protein